jgi:hypothetical protein
VPKAKATESYSVAFVIVQFYCLISCCGEMVVFLELNNIYCFSAKVIKLKNISHINIAKNISIITCCLTNSVDIIIRNPMILTGILIRFKEVVALIPLTAK